MNKIAILMSTYNGEKYIEEQLDSLFKQIDVDFDLYIRDDGSTDGTIDIIDKYKNIHKGQVYVVYGKNIGVIKSFEWLIKKVPESYRYYSFADQDDIWYENKLYSAVSMIREQNESKPIIYISNQNCIKEDGTFIYKRLPKQFLQPCLLTTMMDGNKYSGCTMVINNSLMKRLKYSYKVAGRSLRVIYDIWMLFVAQAVGLVLYDSNAYMDYRRHDGNVTREAFGANITYEDIIARVKNIFITIRDYSYYKGFTSYRAKLLLHCFENEMNDTDIKKVEYLANYNDSFLNWIKMIILNPLRKYYQPPIILTWLKFFVKIY